MRKQQKITIGALVVVAAIAYLVLAGFGGNTGFEVALAQIAGDGQGYDGKYLLTEGYLIPESVKWNADKIELKFKVTDKAKSVTVPVIYGDVAPDNFTYPDAEIILKGKYDATAQVFLAEKVETRCPSTYEAANAEAGQ